MWHSETIKGLLSQCITCTQISMLPSHWVVPSSVHTSKWIGRKSVNWVLSSGLKWNHADIKQLLKSAKYSIFIHKIWIHTDIVGGDRNTQRLHGQVTSLKTNTQSFVTLYRWRWQLNCWVGTTVCRYWCCFCNRECFFYFICNGGCCVCIAGCIMLEFSYEKEMFACTQICINLNYL